MKKRTIIWIIVLLVGGYGAYIGIEIFKAERRAFNNSFTLMNKIPDEYLNLFAKKNQVELSFREGEIMKLRNPIVIMSYESKYSMELTKIDVVPNFNVSRDIIVNSPIAEGTTPNNNFLQFGEPLFIANYRSASNETVSKLYLSLPRQSSKYFLSDDTTSAVIYTTKMSDISYQFKPKADYEFFIEPRDLSLVNSQKQQIDLEFIKKRNRVYILIITSKFDNTMQDTTLLKKLNSGI